MTCRKGARCAFAMHPTLASETTVTIGRQFFARDVVADEIGERTFHARNDFVERFEHERVDEQMVHGREVRAAGQVIEIRVGLWCGEWRIDQLAIFAGQWDVPRGELLLKCAELSARQSLAESTRAG